jgi:hypothetical protein
MAVKNEPYRIYYVAYNFTSGLTDVSLTILAPDETIVGPFIMIESAQRTGVYVYDYIPLIAGQFYAEMNSVATPKAVVEVIDVASSEGGGTTGGLPYADFG